MRLAVPVQAFGEAHSRGLGAPSQLVCLLDLRILAHLCERDVATDVLAALSERRLRSCDSGATSSCACGLKRLCWMPGIQLLGFVAGSSLRSDVCTALMSSATTSSAGSRSSLAIPQASSGSGRNSF